MAERVSMDIIAHIRSDFPAKFGIPRQSGLVDSLRATIVFEPEYRNPDALRGLEGYSHLWLIWQFSQVQQQRWRPTVRPPRLGGNTRMGIFATRSPYRHRPFFGAFGGYSAAHKPGAASAGGRGRFAGRHPHL